MKCVRSCLVIAAAVVVFGLACCTQPLPIAQRPATWAKPIAVPGVPNLHQVSPSLYRGAQPGRAGFVQLRELGINTIINIRDEGSTPDPICEGQQCFTLPMSPWSVDDADVIAFLRMVTDPDRTPVFVHCQHGADRSGVLCAMYRVAVQGWTKDHAIDEMTRNGMGFHDLYQNLISYIHHADVDRIRAAAGIANDTNG